MTARTPNEVIEDQVRLRLQERLVAGGVKSSEVALEVLFWLPVGFVREYQELYMKALALGDGSTGREKAGADEGRVIAKVKSSDRGKPGGMAAQGGGKRYKTEWVVKDENALAEKQRVDRKLAKLAEEISGKLSRLGRDGNRGGNGNGREGNGRERGNGRGERVGQGNGREERMGQSHGGIGGAGKIDWEFDENGERARGRCRDCGKVMSDRWARCPFHDA